MQFIILMLAMLPVSAVAQDRKNVENLAAAVMKARQSGVRMPVAMSILNDEKGVEDIRQLIIFAYEQRRYSTAADRRQITTEFAESAYLACMKSRGLL